MLNRNPRRPESRPAAQPPAASPLELRFDRSRLLTDIFIFCVLVEIGFFVLDMVVNYGRAIDIVQIRRLFNITREDGIASWFAITQTFVVSCVLGAIWVVSRATQSRGVRWGWLFMCLFFLYLAMDDGAMIHERIGSAVSVVREGEAIAGFPSYPWQSVYLPLLGSFGVFMLVFLMRQLHTSRQRWAVIAAMGCLTSAIVLDFFEGLDAGHHLNIYTWMSQSLELDDFAQSRFGVDDYTMLVHFSKAVEEVLEMFAFTLLLVTFLSQLMRMASDVRLRFEDRS